MEKYENRIGPRNRARKNNSFSCNLITLRFILIFKISQSMIEGWTRNGRSRRKNEKQEI